MSYVPIEDLAVYNLAMNIAENIYERVINFPGFYKSSLGRQLMDAADAIAANMSDGHGRYFYKENRNFGSLLETKTWLAKAKTRKLISDEDYLKFIQDLNTLHYQT
jgi:four helix bundle protein